MDELFQQTLTQMESVQFTYRLEIDKINDIAVDVMIGSIKFIEAGNTALSICVYDTWKHHRMWYNYCNTPTEFQEALNTLQTLNYDKLTREFTFRPYDPIPQLGREVLKHIPKGDNVVFSIQDCAICLDPTGEKTSCKHNLCKQCESKLAEKKCPICRKEYAHFERDRLNDMDEEE